MRWASGAGRQAGDRVGAGRRAWARLAVIALVGWSARGARPAHAQQLVLKRSVPVHDATACTRMTAPVTTARPQRERARQLVAQAHAAAIVGDDTTALARFTRAAQLDPTSADIAYDLARAYEGAGRMEAASAAYCRYLSLAPDSSGAADARARMDALPPPATPDVSDQATASFVRGLDRADHQRWDEAVTAFTEAIALAPHWATPYYDRALALDALGRSPLARRDLEAYLRLEPSATDHDAVIARIDALRQHQLDPSVAFASGLLPGVGQLYTHRPVLGLAVLGAVAGATYWAVHTERVTRMQSYTDPNGYTFQYPVTRLERPHLAAGIATASTLTLLGALEAYLYARRHGGGASPAVSGTAMRSTTRSLSAAPTITSGRLGLSLTLHVPLTLW